VGSTVRSLSRVNSAGERGLGKEEIAAARAAADRKVAGAEFKVGQRFSESTQPCVHQWFDRAPASESRICGSQTLSLPKTAKYTRGR
jgi:hypothetical protein